MRSFDNADYSEKIQHDLQFLNCVFQSENHDNRYLLTNLFVAGSQKYIDYLNKYDYLPFYKKKFELIDKYSVSTCICCIYAVWVAKIQHFCITAK